MAFAYSDFTTQFACVFIVFLLWVVSLTPVRRAQLRQEEGYNNSNPREQYQNLPDWGKRAVAASNNTFEGLSMFSISVITQAISQVLHLIESQNVRSEKYKAHAIAANVLCIVYVVTRI
ncbi:15123_t:CDS:2, partial [Entrophospora sp. SA101]